MAVFTNGLTFAHLLTFSSFLSFFLSSFTPNSRLLGYFRLGFGFNSRWWSLHDPIPDHILTRQPQLIAYEQLQSHIRPQSLNPSQFFLYALFEPEVCTVRSYGEPSVL